MMIRYIIVALTVLLLSGCSGKSKEELCAKGKEELGSGNPNGAIVFFKKALEVDQNFAEAREQLATAYIDSGRFEGAERELKKLTVQFPQKPELKLQLAKVYNSMRKPDDSLKVLDEYLAQKPTDSVALEYKGIAFALKKDSNEAERFLLQALHANPGNIEAKLELALVYGASGRDASARKLIDEVLVSEPANTKAYNLLAQMEMARGNKAKALDVYKKLSDTSKNDPMPLYRMGLIYLEQGDMPKTEQVASELANRFPKSGESARFAGILSFKKKSYTEAISALQNSLKIQPTLDGYYYLGMTYYVSGQLESAISQFRAILDRFPTHSRSRIMIGMILLQQKRLDDAMAEMRKVIDEDPGNAFAHNVMGSVLIAKGMVDEGMRELNRATELDPSIVDAHVKKGLINLGRGQVREGEAELSEAVRVNPDLLNSRMLLFSYYMKKNNPRKAESIIQQGVTGKPSDAPLYNALAGARLSQGKTDEALQNFRKAKERDPAFYPAYYNLATYYAAKGQHDAAIAEYQAVIARSPKDLRALLGLAAMYELKGRDKEALDTYLRAKETGQDAAFLAVAGFYARKKETGKSIKVLDEALKVNNKNLTALEMKGKLLATEKKFKEALNVFDDMEQANQGAGIALKIQTYMAMNEMQKAVSEAQRIITLKPNSAAGYMILASIYEKQNDLNRAVDEVKKGIRVEQRNPRAKVQLGELLAQKKDYSAAIAVLKDLIRENSDYAPAHFSLAAVYEQIGKKREAMAAYREALSKAPNYVPALNNLAFLLADSDGNKNEALRLAISAFRAEPGNPGVLDTLGYALLKNGKRADALKALEKAASTLPNNPTVLYHYALALKENGNPVKSLEVVNKALQRGAFPESALAAQLRSELGKGQRSK